MPRHLENQTGTHGSRDFGLNLAEGIEIPIS